MKKNLIWIMALMVMVGGTAWAHEGHDDGDAKTTVASSSASQSMPMKSISMYQCPMHKEVQSSKPGRCPKCGMKMKRVKVSDAAMPKTDKA